MSFVVVDLGRSEDSGLGQPKCPKLLPEVEGSTLGAYDIHAMRTYDNPNQPLAQAIVNTVKIGSNLRAIVITQDLSLGDKKTYGVIFMNDVGLPSAPLKNKWRYRTPT